jgi:hypothetical protein
MDDDFAAIAENVGTGGVNLFSNPDLSAWTRGAGPVLCAADARTYLADHWFCRARYSSTIPGSPSGVAENASYEREADDAHPALIYRAKIGKSTGETDEFGDIEFGQERPARITAALTSGFVVSVEIENQTGTAFRPLARFYSCDAQDDFTAVSLQEEVGGIASDSTVSLGNGARKLWYFRFTNPSYAAALKRGGDIVIVVPETVSNSGFARVYGLLKLEIGTNPTARQQERDQSTESGSSAGTSTGPAPAEYLVNGEFGADRFPSNGAAVSCGVSLSGTSVAHGWLMVNTAGALTTERDTGNAPDSGLSGSCIKLVGDATATAAVQLRQRIYRVNAVTAGATWPFKRRSATGRAQA